jgi:hypothetical protein
MKKFSGHNFSENAKLFRTHLNFYENTNFHNSLSHALRITWKSTWNCSWAIIRGVLHPPPPILVGLYEVYTIAPQRIAGSGLFCSVWRTVVWHPISAFDAGWQPEILSPIARLPAGLYYSILFVQKMRAFRRLVLECFYKQKTTKITLNFPKIIEMQLNSSSQCIQLAMRQANKREKNQLRQREKFKFRLRSLWDWTHDP